MQNFHASSLKTIERACFQENDSKLDHLCLAINSFFILLHCCTQADVADLDRRTACKAFSVARIAVLYYSSSCTTENASESEINAVIKPNPLCFIK